MNPGERAASAVIWFFAADLTRARRIRAWHTPDPRGWCRGCNTQTGVRHPCLVRQLADEALLRSIPTQRKAPP